MVGRYIAHRGLDMEKACVFWRFNKFRRPGVQTRKPAKN
jgi:hypothetical protein